ncbi:MAG TPA: UbiA prenyltransferase family protein [Gaiellaceae bacterium]|nr:UbiA prenyltransferase family protein [Gaiellaceae bacterium]
MTVPAQVVALPARRSRAQALLAALRPAQWSKNLLVFAGIVFAAQLGDARRWLWALTAFVAYCAASSAAYLVNDVRDADNDRRHPIKRGRSVARGEVSAYTALLLAAGLAVAALLLVVPLGWATVGLLAAFLALQAAYTLSLKRLALLDVFAIGALFVIRAAAGAEAVEVRISPWLLVCTALLALFLALAKRRGELAAGVQVPDGYSLALVDQLVAVVAASTVIAYSLYTFTAHSTAMMATIPFVLYGIFRYLLLVHRDDLGEEPEQVLLTDRPILVTVALWAATSAAILELT